MRYTLCIDFDGVIHMATTPFVADDIIADGPVLGVFEWMYEMIQHFDIVIHSTRCRSLEGREAIRNWMGRHSGIMWLDTPTGDATEIVGLHRVTCISEKTPALVYIDDRALRFTGRESLPSKDEVHRLIPWNKKQ